MATPPPASIENNRSDPLRMHNIDSARLARLRPEKNDDSAIKKQISLIQQACSDVDIDADSIALIFHECDYNLQNTIARIKAGDIEQDGGWQTAKPNNKKRNNSSINASEPILNGGTQSDSERSHSQRTSPTPSLRGGASGARRYEYPQHHGSTTQQQYHYSARGGRRGNDSNRNHFNPSNARFARHYSNNKIGPSTTATITSQPLPNESEPIESVPIKEQEQPADEIVQAPSPSRDEYDFGGGATHSLTFDNSLKKSTPLSTNHSHSKRPLPSTIPHEPVSMHPSIKHSNKPLDIQFGDVQWNDSVPTAMNDTFDNDENNKDLSNTSLINTNLGHESHSDPKDDLSSNFCNHHSTNESETQLLETTHPLSSSSISSSLPMTTSNNLANNLATVSLDGTSHLSDHLTEPLSPGVSQFVQQQTQAPLQMTSSITNVSRLPPTSTPRGSDYTSPLSHGSNPFLSGGLQPSLSSSSNGPSAFTPLTTPANYPSMPRDYSHAPQHWNQHPQPSSTYKIPFKQQTAQGVNYQQQTSIQQPQTYPTAQQQPFYFGYTTVPQQMFQMITPIDHWPATPYPSSLEPYQTYQQANYLQLYPSQQYHQANVSLAKPEPIYDKEFFAHYGQTRSSNTDLSYQQQAPPPPLPPSSSSSSSSQQAQQSKDAYPTSKLSANAASFSQGAPLTAAAPTTAIYCNPVAYPVPVYFPPSTPSTTQDRMISYAPIDTRDNRNGALYGGGSNRNHYHHHGQQQRSHNNASNSTWHSQQ